MDSAQIVIFVFVTIIIDNMGKGTHFLDSEYMDSKKTLDHKKLLE